MTITPSPPCHPQFDQGVLRPLTRELGGLAPKLRPPNLESLVHFLGKALAFKLEEGAMAKRFDELGAMFFSEQVCGISCPLCIINRL